MIVLVCSPLKGSDWGMNKDAIKDDYAGVYIPERKCWLVEDADSDGLGDFAHIHGEFETTALKNMNQPALIQMIDKCADFKTVTP